MENNLENIIEMYKEKEETLSPYAMKFVNSKGRENFEAECKFRTPFMRDRDRILHSKAFRRLKRKTQVFFNPTNDHLMTRLTHTLEVSQISRTIARVLNLNEDLTEAIALGHDLGHTPFGHSGEAALNQVATNGFSHNVHSVRVVKHIEKLNLCYETIDGILNHTGAQKPCTLEGQIVKISDRIAYLNHDIEDAIRKKVIKITDIPREFLEYFGSKKNQRITKVVQDIYLHSQNQPEILIGDECMEYMNKLRAWMFENVYFNERAKKREQNVKDIVIDLFNYYKEKDCEQLAIDYVAGMSDQFALKTYREIKPKL